MAKDLEDAYAEMLEENIKLCAELKKSARCEAFLTMALLIAILIAVLK